MGLYEAINILNDINFMSFTITEERCVTLRVSKNGYT